MKRAAALMIGGVLLAPLGEAVRAGEPSGGLDLARLAGSAGFTVVNRGLETGSDGDRSFVRLDARERSGAAWLNQAEFTYGTIEVDLRGRDVQGASFVGVAFHGSDDETYEAIYFRAFNFRAEDPSRRAHAVQYIAHPEHTWRSLRTAHPGKYESAIADAPAPDAWLHARIVVAGDSIRVFVNGAETADLEVTPLTQARGTRVGLWVGHGSPGDFARLSVSGAE